MTLYEITQENYIKLPTITKEEISKVNKDVYNFLKQNPSKYYLLLNNDEHYYTLFVCNGSKFKETSKEIVDIVTDLGELKMVENSGNAPALEFWVANDGKCIMYYLFDYTNGVIEIE